MGMNTQDQKRYNERVPKGYVHLVKEVIIGDDTEPTLVHQRVQPVNVDVHIEKYDFQFASEEEKDKYLQGLRGRC